jgi:hypothetical protein
MDGMPGENGLPGLAGNQAGGEYDNDECQVMECCISCLTQFVVDMSKRKTRSRWSPWASWITGECLIVAAQCQMYEGRCNSCTQIAIIVV